MLDVFWQSYPGDSDAHPCLLTMKGNVSVQLHCIHKGSLMSQQMHFWHHDQRKHHGYLQ